jgi:rSAM/selenodomain-associated transferase 2
MTLTSACLDQQSTIRPEVSIVVPVLNEAALIQPFLLHLRERASSAEVIVVDGGSTDTTVKLAEEFGARVVHAAPNRAVQMNTGAQIARGTVLWFLHVDLTVPSGCLDEITRSLADPKTVGGFFRIRLPRPGFVYRLTDEFAHYAGILLRMRCGDHGFFCRRHDFFSLGGFPEVPVMEDVAFFRRLRRRGRVAVIKLRIVANDRRYQVVGPTRLTFAYAVIGLLYFFGASLSLLSRIYDRLCCHHG